MHGISVSLIGVAVSEVRHGHTSAGVPIARFRMVSQPRRYDTATGTYIEHAASYVTVVAWRALADHITDSIRKGDPVVVVGRLRVREFDVEGHTRVIVEVDAWSVGHDLSRGVGSFTRTARGSAPLGELDRPEEPDQVTEKEAA